MRARGICLRARVAVYVALLISIPAAAQTAGLVPSIDNFGTVNQTYYRGAQPTGRAYNDLAASGVKLVIDLQEDGLASEPALVQSAGMKFVRIPMNTRVAPTPDQVALFLKLVNDPSNQPVYVHCAGGRHRTGVMTAVYRMTQESWSAEKAFQEMKQYRFGADFLHPEFKRFVYTYQPAPAAPAETLAGTATN
jgi:protein tyrosine/serine phosphatase